MAYLEVRNLYKNFGDLKVLKGVSFDLDRGEVLSIIGPSGNGKTTILRCLNFLETPDDGEITVDGKKVFPSKMTTCPYFGMVFQNFNLFPQYNVLKNVTLALDLNSERELKKQKISFIKRKIALKEIKAENEELAKSLLKRVGLGDKLLSYPCELSGGQSQRVAIARALALKPEILCFDEPTSALDPELTGEVLKVIKGLKEEGRTMIIVTHEMNFAKSVSDKVILMNDGVIEEQGNAKEVFENPKTEKMKAFIKSAEGGNGYDG